MFHKILIPTVALVFVTLTAASVVKAQQVAFEPKYDSDYYVTKSQAQAAAKMVKLAGYRCDSISDMHQLLTRAGYVIYCNYFRYEYDIEDKGGQWTVTVQ